MKIRLDRIGAEPHRWQETLAVSPAQLERTEMLDLGEISWSGKVESDGPRFRVEAALSYEQTLACDRCLAPIVQTLESEVALLVLPNAPQPTDEELELSAEDLEVLYLEGAELDLQEILLEQLQLNVPMRAICKEDCQGLCPHCGINRNLETCACETATTDPRWEALRSLQKDN
jgi:uncharacterized protein